MGRKRNDEKIQVVNIRMVKEPSIYSESRISCPEDAVKAIAKDMATYDREVFAVMNLKTNGQIINLNICSMGTLDASMVSPREVFKSSILSNAASFIAIHNHPSGSLVPFKIRQSESGLDCMACRGSHIFPDFTVFLPKAVSVDGTDAVEEKLHEKYCSGRPRK